MKTMTVGEFKARFSDVINEVKAGEEVAVTFEKKKEIVGYFKLKKSEDQKEKRTRLLGPLKHLGYDMAEDFRETSQEEFPIIDSFL